MSNGIEQAAAPWHLRNCLEIIFQWKNVQGGLSVGIFRGEFVRMEYPWELFGRNVQGVLPEAPTPLGTGGTCPPLSIMAGHGGHREQNIMQEIAKYLIS